MTKFLTEPSVHLIAHTVIDPEALDEWAVEHGFMDVADDNGTPLGKLVLDVSNAPMRHSLDALTEFGGRHCYRSWGWGRDRGPYIDNIMESRHGSVLRHSNVSFAISGVSRSLSHELVRHAAGCAPSQESQRYVDASDINFIVPPLLVQVGGHQESTANTLFRDSCHRALTDYRNMQALFSDLLTSADTIDKKRINEASRAVLPNASETRLLWTMNLQAARFVCEQRSSFHADLEIRRLFVAILRVLQKVAPLSFTDFEVYTAEDGFEAGRCKNSKV